MLQTFMSQTVTDSIAGSNNVKGGSSIVDNSSHTGDKHTYTADSITIHHHDGSSSIIESQISSTTPDAELPGSGDALTPRFQAYTSGVILDHPDFDHIGDIWLSRWMNERNANFRGLIIAAGVTGAAFIVVIAIVIRRAVARRHYPAS
jgi:hypothetical protein